ncbi:hypothetical protein [Neisseria sp. 20925_1_37]|uniref:hypothetical protein n=1 Tax=Neisseria sp. 20925_1_37 TaxID=3003683 RepID=UPI00352C1C52
MDSQNRKGALYQIVAFVLAKPALLILVKLSTLVLAKRATLVLAKRATLVFRRPESGLRYNFEMDLFG